MPAEMYDLRGVYHDRADKTKRPINRKVRSEKVLDLLGMFKANNASGYHVVGRAADFRYVFIDDLSQSTWDMMISEGYRPCVVVESSNKNFQAFFDAGEGTDEFTAKALARVISPRFGGDPGSADAHHLGRVPGFTNQKIKYRNEAGQYPLAALRTASRRVCPITSTLRTSSEVIDLAALYRAEKERTSGALAEWNVEEEASPSGAARPRAENGALRALIPDDSSSFRAKRFYDEGMRFFTSKYGNDIDRSRADYGIARRMMERGFPDDSIIVAVASGEKASGQSDPLRYAIHTVDKVRQALCKNVDETPEPTSPTFK